MAGPIPMGPFAMPMYREWVPKSIRPWIYVLMAVMFQLSGCIYLGAASQITGTTGVMRDDVMFIGLCNVVGVNMPFPFLFRYKFRFTNKHLLMTSALVIAGCNLLTLVICNSQLSILNSQLKLIPLCVLSSLAGYFKLCGTFECMSNIQLWMAPGRDFKIFFPLLYIIVIGDIFLQSWVAGVVTYYYSWQMMNWLVIGLMLLIVFIVFTLTKPFRFMKPIPLISIDWLGCILWSLCILELVWLFNYGEYYNWIEGLQWRYGVVMFFVTLFLTIGRARHIRHPYIEMAAFRYKNLLPLLVLFVITEWLDSTPKVLQNTLASGVLHWGWMTTNVLQLVGWIGNALGCLFTLFWMKQLKKKYTSLLTIGGMCMVAYQVMMYFYVSPTLNLERLYLPTLLRAIGFAIYFTALTIYLEELMPFQHFFMGLTICGIIRNGPVGSLMGGVYGYSMRHQVAENLSRGIGLDPMQALMVSIKQLYGITCLIGIAFELILLLWHVQPVRSTMKRMKSFHKLAKQIIRQHE